jgi:hypothetical protein
MWLGANFSASFTKSVYTSAALGFREKYSFISLMFILSAFAGMISGMATAKLNRPSKIKEESHTTSKIKTIFSLFMAVGFFLSGTYIMASNFIELQLNASFNQRLTVLAANVSDQQIKELKASWALMEGRSDYEKLTAQMNGIANKEKIKLPVALWE